MALRKDLPRLPKGHGKNHNQWQKDRRNSQLIGLIFLMSGSSSEFSEVPWASVVHPEFPIFEQPTFEFEGSH